MGPRPREDEEGVGELNIVEATNPPRALVSRSARGPLLFVLGSFLLCATVVLVLPAPTSALRAYTDHLRNPACSFVALERGADIYRRPFGELFDQSAFKRKIRLWPQVRYLYPPGALVAFAPMALLGQALPISDGAYYRACGLYVLLLTHLALWLMLRRLMKLPHGWGIPAMAVAWICCARSGLSGQFEPLWLAAAVCMLAAAEEHRTGAALAWLGLATLLHYRAATLLPFGVAVVVPLLRTSPRRWPWAALAFTMLCGALSLACFLSAVGDAEHEHLITRPGDALFIVDVLVTLAGLGLACHARNPYLALTILAVGAIGMIDPQHWWHATPVLVPLLARDVGREWEHPGWMTMSLTAWAVGMQYVWVNRPLELFLDVWRAF